MSDTNFPMFKIDLYLPSSGRYWAEHVFCSFDRAKECLRNARIKRGRRITRINNAAELERAEAESERLWDWATD